MVPKDVSDSRAPCWDLVTTRGACFPHCTAQSSLASGWRRKEKSIEKLKENDTRQRQGCRQSTPLLCVGASFAYC